MLKKFWMLLAFIGLLLVSCQEPTEEEEENKPKPSIVGSWKSSHGDGFEISGGNYYQYDNVAAKTIAYAGTIVKNSDFTSTSGYITIKITNIGTWQKTSNYYYVVYWKNFNGNGISQSSAVKDYTDTNEDWIDDNPLNKGRPNQTGTDDSAAEWLYTLDHGYFDGFSDCIKQ